MTRKQNKVEVWVIEVQELSYFRVTCEDLLSLKAMMQKGLDIFR